MLWETTVITTHHKSIVHARFVDAFAVLSQPTSHRPENNDPPSLLRLAPFILRRFEYCIFFETEFQEMREPASPLKCKTSSHQQNQGKKIPKFQILRSSKLLLDSQAIDVTMGKDASKRSDASKDAG